MQSILNEPENETWTHIAPLLDNALERLGQKDHDALVLRFFENKNFAEVGAALGASEDTARIRVNRALEKLRKTFAKRGVNSTTAMLAGAISANSVQAAPVGLAVKVSAVAVAKGAAAGISTLTLVKGALKIMAWTKIKTVIVAGAVVLFAVGTTTTTIIISRINTSSVDESLWEMKLENLKKAPWFTMIIRPTRFTDHKLMNMTEGPFIGHNMDFRGLLAFAYGSSNKDGFDLYFSRERMVLPTDAPQDHYDLMFIYPNSRRGILQRAISKRFGYRIRKEIRQTDALLLEVKDSALLALHVSKKGTRMNIKFSEGMRAAFGQPLSDTARFMEGAFNRPVLVPVDSSERYDLTFQWQDPQQMVADLNRELEAAGLQLVPTNMPIEMLVVEKVK